MEGKNRERRKAVLLIVATVLAVTVASLLFLFYTKAGKRLTSKVVAGYLHDVVTYIPGGNGELMGNEEGDELSQIQKPADAEADGKEKEFYHILLLGEEAIRSTPGKGRTDAIILATVHVKEKKIILTSVLRDTYVEPEGMKPNKINAVYGKLGVNGLYKILYDKLGVWPDGYVKVGFDSFEKVIDLLGGAEVTLTADEAQYLNTHDYISNEAYRNVVTGTQVLNGNQTLGYCRIRHVANCNGKKYDYGRTERQRMVLENLFERYMKAGITKWAKILKEALGYVETDISEETMQDLIYAVYEGKITTMEQRQIPAKNTYESMDLNGVTSTLVLDWEANKEEFWNALK
ncbi:MAG: LCP family protein [Lachnospiraceae bacterium]|nr:LCP family protein [Lachnospiraceae bacterium]